MLLGSGEMIYLLVYPIQLSLCSDVSALISDRRSIYARQPKFDFTPTEKGHVRDIQQQIFVLTSLHESGIANCSHIELIA